MNSTPIKKNVAAVEKKAILQHLMTPAVHQSSTESMAMAGGELELEHMGDTASAETSFTIDAAVAASAAAAAAAAGTVEQPLKR